MGLPAVREPYVIQFHSPKPLSNSSLLNQQALAHARPRERALAEGNIGHCPVFSAKGWLSLNWLIGCPLDCAYCYRISRRDKDESIAKLYDEEFVVDYLFQHPYFVPHYKDGLPEFAPSFIGLHTSSTEAFVPAVKRSTFRMLELLEQRQILNPVVIITKWFLEEEDVQYLEQQLKHVQLYIGVCGASMPEAIEPASKPWIRDKRLAFLERLERSPRLKAVHYWRPIAIGWNDSPEQLAAAREFARAASAVLLGGITLWDDEIEALGRLGISAPAAPEGGWQTYGYRRKYLPKDLERRIIAEMLEAGIVRPTFRRASCSFSYLHGIADANGYRLENMKNCTSACPPEQQARCAAAPQPNRERVLAALARMGTTGVSFEIEPHAVVVDPGEARFGLLDCFALRHLLAFPALLKGQPQ